MLDYPIIPSSSFSQISMTWLENSHMLCTSKSVDYSEACFFFSPFFFHGAQNALTFEGPEAPADPGGQVEDALGTKPNFKWPQRPCEYERKRVIINDHLQCMLYTWVVTVRQKTPPKK